MKTLLMVATLLVGGSNVWADTETFGASQTASNNAAITGTAVTIAGSSNPSGVGSYTVFNNKSDNGLKLRTGSPLTLNVNSGYRVTGVTVYAYQNNESSKTITCDSYSVDGAAATDYSPVVSIPLNVKNASTQTLATISTGTINASTSIVFNFTNTGEGDGQNQIYAFIEVTYESLTKTVVNIPCTGASSTLSDGDTYSGTVGSMVISQPNGNAFKITTKNSDNYMIVGTGTGTVTISEEDRAGYAHISEGKNYDIVEISFSMVFGNTAANTYSGFEVQDKDGNVIVTLMSSKWSGINSSANTFGIEAIDLTTQTSNTTIWSQKTNFNLIFNYQTGKITCKTNNNATGKTIDMPAEKPVVAKFVLKSADIRSNGSDDSRQPFFSSLVIKNTEGNYDVTSANYTVQWVLDGTNTVIKEDVRSGEVDSNITLDSSDLASFWASTQKYYYVSDDADGKEVADDGSTVVTVTVREAYNWSYTIIASTGETLSTGTGVEGEVTYYHYKQVINHNGTLYKANKDNTGVDTNGYKSKFTLDENNKVITKTYSQPTTPITNLVFLAEGEDLFTSTTGSSADTRCSMGAGGYASSKTAFVTLPAGTYYLVMSNRCTNTRTGIHNFYKGDDANPFFAADGNGYNAERESGEFTLDETTTLYMQGGDANQYVDWLYIYGTPTNEIVGAVDFSTGYLGATSEKITLKPGESYHYQFVNHTNGGNNWYNWHLPVYKSDDSRPITLRVDWWEDMNGSTTAEHQRGFSSNAANYWNNVPSKLDGVTIDMTVTFTTDKKFVMTSTNTAKDATTWTYNYTSDNENNIDLTGEDYIKVALSVNTSWLEVLSESKTTVSATIGSTGWTTFASPYALDLSGMTASEGEVTAYYASSIGSGNVTMTSTDKNDVIAGEGLMLKGTANAIVTIPVVASGTAISGNKLVGCTASTDLATNANYYVLVNNNGTAEFQSLATNGATIPAGKAYLNAGKTDARLSIVFEDEAAGIKQIDSSMQKVDGYYNLNGQHIQNPTKGLYIVNGKKVIIK